MAEETSSQNLPAQTTLFSQDEMRLITSWEDAQKLLEQSGIQVRDASTEIGDGFTMCEDKDELVNRPMLVLMWMFTDGDFDSQYVIVRIVTPDGRKLIVTDGGTGLCTQLKDYQARTGVYGGLMVQRGLRRSDYEFEDDDGKKRPAKTYYLNV